MTKVKVYAAEGVGAHKRSVERIAEVLDATSIENISIERVIDGESTVTQEPTGLGDTNAIQVTFGPGAGGVSLPLTLGADGSLTVNETGLYRIKIALQFGRSGASGTSVLMFRVLLNGTQAGRSVVTKLSNADVTSYFENDTWIYLPAGAVLSFEVTRDSAGSDFGGLFYTAASGSWNDAPSAALRVERYKEGL